MLNRKFEDLLKQVIDEEEFFKLRRTDVFRRAMLKFDEDIKPNYVSTSQKSYLIDFQGTRLTDQPKLNLKGNCFTLTKYVSKLRQSEILIIWHTYTHSETG